jgi:hypothetical protein
VTVVFEQTDLIISMGLVMAGSPRLNLEHQLDHDGHPTTLSSGDGIGPAFAPNGVPPSWSWRETNATGKFVQLFLFSQSQPCVGTVVLAVDIMHSYIHS